MLKNFCGFEGLFPCLKLYCDWLVKNWAAKIKEEVSSVFRVSLLIVFDTNFFFLKDMYVILPDLAV